MISTFEESEKSGGQRPPLQRPEIFDLHPPSVAAATSGATGRTPLPQYEYCFETLAPDAGTTADPAAGAMLSRLFAAVAIQLLLVLWLG